MTNDQPQSLYFRQNHNRKQASAPSRGAAVTTSRFFISFRKHWRKRSESPSHYSSLSKAWKRTPLVTSSSSVASLMRRGHLFHHAVEVEAAGLLARWEIAEALQPLRDVAPGGREHEPRWHRPCPRQRCAGLPVGQTAP